MEAPLLGELLIMRLGLKGNQDSHYSKDILLHCLTSRLTMKQRSLLRALFATEAPRHTSESPSPMFRAAPTKMLVTKETSNRLHSRNAET